MSAPRAFGDGLRMAAYAALALVAGVADIEFQEAKCYALPHYRKKKKMKNADRFPLQPDPDCLLCNHPQRVAAASMRELQASDEEIATAIALSVEDVERHFASCVKVVLLNPADLDRPLDASASDQQLQVLLGNATELYHSAVLQGNMVAASSALPFD